MTCRSARHIKKGFTLLELIVVFGITAFLSALIGAGVIYLQNAVRLDNGIRDIKAEIQSTQNNARNSFISASRNEALSDTLTARAISVGWMINIKNLNTNSILVTKRAIYYQRSQTGQYSFDNLRSDIQYLRNTTLQGKNFGCDSTNQFMIFSGSTATPVKLQGDTVTGLKCADSLNNSASLERSGDYTPPKEMNGIQLELVATDGISRCAQTIGNTKEVNLFFTSGYGETALNVVDTACQIQIRNTGNLGINYRATSVAKDTGSVGICGDICGKAAPVTVTTTVTMTVGPLPSVTPTRVTNPTIRPSIPSNEL